MESNVKEGQVCPNCGAPLPGGALAGLCPACLLAQGAETESGGGPQTGGFTPPAIEDLAGLFPQLEVLGLLGAGGMGAVYQARQPGLDRLVALKILPPAGAGGASFADRFNREARALARLNHPNIVAVHEFGQAGGLPYFIMEYVDGTNLRQLEQTARLSPREALQIIPQICDALQYAHDEGVVHRDIKPENVLIDRRGRVKIADFGLAKILGADAESQRLTVEGQVMGTPHYMAPEQVEKPLTVDHRADIYALGVVFYEMLTGELPLGRFSPPSSRVRGMEIDVRLDEVVLRALENDPARRYQKASEVKTRVEIIAGTPPPTAPAPAAGRDYPTRRMRYWAGFAVVREEEGRRHVNWPGVIHALAIVFALLTLLAGSVPLITGDGRFGWLGVVAWPGVLARLGLAMAIVAWGILRAWRRGAPAQPDRTPADTVVVEQPTAWWWSSRLGGIALATLCAVAIGLTGWRREVLPGFAPKPALVAMPNPVTGAWVARLPDQGTVELVAIGAGDAAPTEWWQPDGTPHAATTFDVREPGRIDAPDGLPRDLIFRFSDLPAGSDLVGIQSDPPSPYAIGEGLWQNGNPVSGAWAVRMAWPESVRTANVRMALGVASWQTVATHAPAVRQTTFQAHAGGRAWRFEFHHVVRSGGQTIVTVVRDPDPPDHRIRIVAVDHQGTEHAERSAQVTPSGETITWTHSFDLPPEAIREFRAQVRPLQWVEFANVAVGVPAGAGFRNIALQPQSLPTPERLAEPPRLRFVAWQDQWDAHEREAARRPDGGPVTDPDDLDPLRRARPTRCDVSGMMEDGEQAPPFLHLWITHPLFDQQSFVSVALLGADGQPLPLGAHGMMGNNVQPRDPPAADTGWMMHTFSPGAREQPRKAHVRLEYAVGPLERTRTVAPDFGAGMALEGNTQLNAIGSNSDGKSFVALALNRDALGPRQFGALAVTRDGRELGQAGGGQSGSAAGPLVQRLLFDVPLSQIQHFIIGTRPIRTVDWPEVVLPPVEP